MAGNDRTEEERSSDLILLLHLINRHNRTSPRFLGITKVDKFVFLSEKEMNDDHVKGFDHRFFRHNYGPLAPSLYSDMNLLREAKLIVAGKDLTLTRRGLAILEQLQGLLDENRFVTGYVDRTVSRFTDFDTNQTREQVYDIEIQYPMGSKRIRDIPKGWRLISKLPSRGAERRFDVSESWVETIEILLDIEFSEQLDEILQRPTVAHAHPFEGIR